MNKKNAENVCEKTGNFCIFLMSKYTNLRKCTNCIKKQPKNWQKLQKNMEYLHEKTANGQTYFHRKKTVAFAFFSC